MSCRRKWQENASINAIIKHNLIHLIIIRNDKNIHNKYIHFILQHNIISNSQQLYTDFLIIIEGFFNKSFVVRGCAIFISIQLHTV